MTTQTQAQSIFRMFYTHLRTKQILEAKGIRVKNIEKVSINKPNGKYYCAVHVVYRVANGGRCSTFISCREYLQVAIQKRKEQVKDYKVFQDRKQPSVFRVSKVNPNTFDSDKFRTVVLTPEVVMCDCEDFTNQGDYLSQHPYLWHQVIQGYKICKHSFAALSCVGFNSLSSYLQAWKPGGRLNNLSVTMNRKTA